MSSNNVNIKIPRKYSSLFRSTIMALIMSSIMSVPIISLNAYLQCSGSVECFQTTFFIIWSRTFPIAFALAISIVLTVAPFVMRITNKIA
jgi:Protein of unknown function (DUF2798)